MADDQLRYQCTRCGNCCRWQGYVRITAGDIDRIAEFLGLGLQEFIDRYTCVTSDRCGLSLTENSDRHCIFLSRDGGCMIQPVKPEQCRQFPNFWNFPGFREKCRAVDTWEQGTEDGARATDDAECTET